MLTIVISNACIAETVKVVTFAYYPIGKPDSTGLNPEIVKAAFQAIGYNVAFAFYPRKRAITIFSGADDMLFMGEARYFQDISDELDAQEFINYNVALIYKKNRFPSLEFSRIEDLKGYVLGVSLGSNLTSRFQKAGWKVEEVSELEHNLRKLMSDRIDFWGTVDLTGATLVKDFFPDQAGNIGSLNIEKFPLELVAKKNTVSGDMLNLFRSGMIRIIENGTYMNILKKYYGDNMPTPEPVGKNDIQPVEPQ